MRYVVSSMKQKQHETAYRIYVTDTLQKINENIANRIGGVTLVKRYADIIADHKPPDRTQEEVIADISNKLKGL